MKHLIILLLLPILSFSQVLGIEMGKVSDNYSSMRNVNITIPPTSPDIIIQGNNNINNNSIYLDNIFMYNDINPYFNPFIMAKKTKQPRTIVPIANKAASGKGSRLPEKPMQYFWRKGTSKFHD